MSEPATRNWLLRIAYDGTDVKGWQRQKAGVPTVQSLLEDRLAKLYKQPITLYGMSRTDAGVHALDQRATIHVPPEPAIPVASVRLALNHGLPSAIRILSIEPRPDGFHARHASVGKAYTYLLYRGVTQSPFLSRYSWHIYSPLDLAPMREAAVQLLGTHDFTTFSANVRGDTQPDPVKTLHRIDIAEHGPVVRLTVIGNSFLYKMMRRLVGFLVSVGRGRFTAAYTTTCLQARDRSTICETAPPQGLFLDRAFFDRDTMLAYTRNTLPMLDLVNLPQAEELHHG